MNNSVHIFLGANSASGFYSLYEQLLNGRLDDLLIIKGGPGCGKSSFMRTVAKALTAAGAQAIYINCSGDPESLDGVLFPAQRFGLVDGTAPHVLEPTYTAAAERYLDLSPFYDLAAVKARRTEIVAHTDAYREAYREAYRVLRAADAVESERCAAVRAAMDFKKLGQRVSGILRREIRSDGKRRGRIDKAFLGGMTHKGENCCFDTVEALCPRRYVISDSFALAAGELERVSDAAAEAGYDVLTALNPDRPQETAHLLIPALGLAFVTDTTRLPYLGEAYRRIRVDVMAETKLTRAERAKLRLLNRMEAILRDEATAALSRAKEAHDALEALYNPCVNFDGVYELAAREASRLLQMMCAK